MPSVSHTVVLALLLTWTAASGASVSQFKTCLSSSGSTPAAYYPSSSPFQDVIAQSVRSNLQSPAAVVQPSSERQVKITVKCARKAGFSMCPRSGGHDYEGQSRCSGVMVDLVKLQKITLNKATKVVTVEPAAMLGQVAYELYQQSSSGDRRCVPIGVCPGVGIGGYVLGGGHGPYSGLLGLTCDRLQMIRMVDRKGKIVVARRNKNSDLFKASCGGSGGIFGIVTKIKLKTASCKKFDSATVFRFQWDLSVSGEVIQKWLQYKQDNGNTWARMEVNKGEGVTVYGVCWGSPSANECLTRLRAHDFFRVGTRKQLVLTKVSNVLYAQGFVGPAGNWARNTISNVKDALTSYRYSDAGSANNRMYQSVFFKTGGSNGVPSKQYWQTFAERCSKAFSTSASFVVCQWNPWANRVKKSRNNYFPFRDSTTLFEVILPVGGSEATAVRKSIHDYVAKYRTGIYVNYPEPISELPGPYQKLYWGKFLSQVRAVKNKYNPCNTFEKTQTVQSSPGACSS